MPRVVGVDIPANKRIEVALTYIFGIGDTRAKEIVKQANLDPSLRAKDLSEDDVSRIASIIEKNYSVEGPLRRQVSQDVGRLVSIGCYRGLRHRRGLPVRGQRTRTNARTRKGKKKTVASKRGVKDLK